jgi:hypothetical protein
MPSVFIERLNAHVHLGKNDPKPVPDAISFDELRAKFVAAGGTFPPMPAHFGFGGDFGGGPIAQGGWGMLGNGPCDDGSIEEGWAAYAGAGDCAWADPAHDEMEAAKNAGRPIPPFTCLNILTQYAAYVASVNNGQGYDLQTGANDTGSSMADVIVWRQTKGLLDTNGVAYKIGKAVSLTPGDLQDAWEATYLFQNVDLGVVLTQANMDEFNAGQAWDYSATSPEIGGHAIPEIGRASLDNSGIITWAERHGFTQAFFTKQNDEGHAYIDNERYNAVTGETSQGYDDQDLEKFVILLPAYLAKN